MSKILAKEFYKFLTLEGLLEILLIISREIYLIRDNPHSHFQAKLKFKIKILNRKSRHNFLILSKWVKIPLIKAQNYSKIHQKNCYFKTIIINFSIVYTVLFDKLNFLKEEIINLTPSKSLEKFRNKIKLISIIKMNIQATIMIKIIH